MGQFAEACHEVIGTPPLLEAELGVGVCLCICIGNQRDARPALPCLDLIPSFGSAAMSAGNFHPSGLTYGEDPEIQRDIKDAGVVTRDTWKGRIWDTWDLPRPERRMLLKVDAVLLTLCSVRICLQFQCDTGRSRTWLSCAARLLLEEPRSTEYQ